VQPAEATGTATAMMSYVGVGRRFAALVVDGLVSLVWTIPLSHITSTSDPTTVTIRVGGTEAWLAIAIWLAYFVAMEAVFGATVGKLALRIRVVQETGLRITQSGALVRNLARVVDGFPWVVPYLVGAIAVWNSPTGQRLGDRWAHTVVIVRGSGPWTRRLTAAEGQALRRTAAGQPPAPPPLPPPPPGPDPRGSTD
jgi:uncharacterized RDD family membrane protein YckC